MNSRINILLNTSPEQTARLQELQAAFAEVCNALAPVVQQKRCWNRVTLHHLTYHALRERFPKIGSQMVCNAIYSVSRTSRLVLQHPQSPWNIARFPEAALPLLQFAQSAPVYFDRHTLSFKEGKLSMYTLDGRMRFHLDLSAEDQARFRNEKLREIVLSNTPNTPNTPQGYQLSFLFGSTDETANEDADTQDTSGELPEYVVVISEPDEAASLQSSVATLLS